MSSPTEHGHPDEDILLDLVHGLLPSGEEMHVLAHLESCVSCEERFRERVAETERSKVRARESLARPAAPAAPATPAAHRARWRWSPRLAWVMGGSAAAVALACLAIAVFLPRGAAPDATAMLHWLPAADEAVVSRGLASPDRDPALVDGLRAYEQHDAARAADALSRAHAEGAMADVLKIYYGSALAWNRDFAGAARELSAVKTFPLPEPWRGETQWTLCISLRGSGDVARADSLLRLLAKDEGEIGDRARKALAKPDR
jgi:hypothetical protein